MNHSLPFITKTLPLLLLLPLFGLPFNFLASSPEKKSTPKQEQQSQKQEQQSQKQKIKSDAPKDKAVERTKRQVKMLDDIYKGGIVLITTHYVNGDEDLPAGTAFKKLFEAAKNKGWHEVRLVDATGEPYNDENVAITEFEKRAIKQLKAGKPFVDETLVEKKKRYLLAATPIPVVMDKCTMCHDNYDLDKKGLVVGALTYRVPIDE